MSAGSYCHLQLNYSESGSTRCSGPVHLVLHLQDQGFELQGILLPASPENYLEEQGKTQVHLAEELLLQQAAQNTPKAQLRSGTGKSTEKTFLGKNNFPTICPYIEETTVIQTTTPACSIK